jgi:hypothetical protein
MNSQLCTITVNPSHWDVITGGTGTLLITLGRCCYTGARFSKLATSTSRPKLKNPRSLVPNAMHAIAPPRNELLTLRYSPCLFPLQGWTFDQEGHQSFV